MTKETYLEKLEKLLEDIDPKEKEAALAYCREYFEEAEDKDIEQIIKELGTPEEFAKQLKNDATFKQKITPPVFKYSEANKQNQTTKKKSKGPFIIAGVLVFLVVCGLALRFAFGLHNRIFMERENNSQISENYNAQNNQSSTTTASEYTASEFHNIEIEATCDVEIVKGSTNRIYYQNVNENEVLLETKNNKIELEVYASNSDSKVIVEIAGSIDNLDIESKNGDITASQISGNKIELNAELGNISVESLNFSVLSLENSNGNISGSLSGKFEDYRYEIENENGTTNVGTISNSNYIEEKGNFQGTKKLDIENSNGDISLEFVG